MIGHIKEAFDNANLTLDAIDGVEMIGGGWRIPKIQTLVNEYLVVESPHTPIPMYIYTPANNNNYVLYIHIDFSFVSVDTKVEKPVTS